jgi:hypothetical protein
MDDTAVRTKAILDQAEAERKDLTTPHACQAGYVLSNFGTELSAIEPFTAELMEIVDTMKEQLASEARLLEGVEVPDYTPLPQNELSQSETKEAQWKTPSPHGSWTIVRTPISPPELNSSSSTARPNSPASPLELLNGRSSPSSTGSCSGKEDGFGCAIDATNECSVCTVPMISEQMLGTPSVPK